MVIEKTGWSESETGKPISLQIEVAALSDIGCQRSNNEDSFGYDSEGKIFVVCDGMGGTAAGEVASNVAVHQTLESYKKYAHQGSSPEECLQLAIASANQAVWQLSKANHAFRGMGTTLVAACVHNNHIVIGNVGDSRAYFLRDGGCLQITEDHSLSSNCTPNSDSEGSSLEAAPILQCFITRAVGVEPEVKPDLFVAELQAGDIVLLATDGLTRYIDAEEIARAVHSEQNLETICRHFVSLVHERGAIDNMTCLLIRSLSKIS